MDDWETREARAVIAAVYGESLTNAVLLQCRKLARERGVGDRFRDYVSVAIAKALELPDTELETLLAQPPKYVSVVVRNAINDAERHDYVTRLTAMHEDKSRRYVNNLDYTLLSPVAVGDDNTNTPFDTVTAELAWRNSVTDDDSTDSRIAGYRARFDDAFGRLALPDKRIKAFLLVKGDGLTYSETAKRLDSSQGTVHRWVKRVTERLKADLGVKEPKAKRRRKRKPAIGQPTAAELATVAGLLTVDPVTAMLARKAACQSGKIPPKHRGAKVTVTRGEPRERATCITPFGQLAYASWPLVLPLWQVQRR